MDDPKNNNIKLRLKFEKQIKIDNLILLSDGRLCSTEKSSITLYDKSNYQIQSKIKLKSLIEDIVELSSDLIVKQKNFYELYIFRKKDFKIIQLTNHRFVVETIFEVNKKLIICTKYDKDLGIEIWEKDKNNLYILTGFLINNLISSYCFIHEENIKSNVFFCENPLSKGLKDSQRVMQEKNRMDQEYSKLRDQRQKLIQEREELKRKIQLINDQLYQLAGGHEEKTYRSHCQFNPMIPHSIQPIQPMQPTIVKGQRLQYYYDRFGQPISYLPPNPAQQMMGMQGNFQINPMYPPGQLIPMMPQGVNPHIYQGMEHPFYHSQINPMMSKAQRNITQFYINEDFLWKESTKFSTNILINYSKNKISSIDLGKNYLNIKIFTIKVNENKLVSAFIYKYTSPTIISIKICDLKTHIGSIMVMESRIDLNFIDSIIDIDGNYILFGIWLIDINSCQIVFKFNIFERKYKKYFKLLNGNILIYSIDNNFSGEYKIERNQLVKIKENFIEESDIIIENKDKEIITFSNNKLKIWEKSN